MLLVLALAAAVVALATAGYSATAQAAAVTAGADMISDALTEARADAIEQNTTVEVRIYAMTQSGPLTTPFRTYTALQLHWLKADKTTPPVNKALLLPSQIAIDATVAHSPLIAVNGQAATPDVNDSRLNSDTRVFHFLPDGSTDLDPATNWFLTVRSATQSDPAHFPTNWACITINATTGRSQIYRP